MSGFGIRKNVVAALAAIAGAVGYAHFASAVTIDFEDPPYVAGANIVGQDGWVQNSYVGPGLFLEVNGDVTSSTSMPLTGAQSLLYAQTSVAGANGGGADVSKADVITIVRDGTPAVDLLASFLIQADAGAFADGQVGVFLSFNAFGGNSPIGVLLNGANSANATGRIEVLDTTGFLNPAPYTAGNELEFRFGVNFDGTQDYELSVRDVTAGQVAFTSLVGPQAGRFGFFNAANVFPDDGDGISYTVDVGTLLRGGTGRIDNITLAQVPEPATLALALLGMVAMIPLRRTRS